jgi:hypothetical protein
MNIPTENPKESTEKRINKFSKVVGDKTNTQASSVFLTESEEEIKKAIPLIITSKRIKFSKLNLAKEIKDFVQ